MKLESPEKKWTYLEATFYLDGKNQKALPIPSSEGGKTGGL